MSPILSDQAKILKCSSTWTDEGKNEHSIQFYVIQADEKSEKLIFQCVKCKFKFVPLFCVCV